MSLKLTDPARNAQRDTAGTAARSMGRLKPFLHPDIVWLIAATIVVRCIGSILMPVYDDAFISYRYGRNLALGHGLSYNPGDHVIGVTTPAFVIVVALLDLLRLPVPGAVLILNVIADAVLVAITYQFLTAAWGRRAAVLFGLLYAASPIVVRICVGGMESNVFLLASVAAVLLWCRGRRTGAVALAAATFALRPEGILLAALLVACTLLSSRRQGVVAALAAAAIVGGVVGAEWGWSGHLVPQSVIAKSQLEHPDILDVATQLLVPDPLCAPLLLLAVLGFRRVLSAPGPTRLIAVWAALYAAAYLLWRPMMWNWYTLPVVYGMTLVAAPTIAVAIDRLKLPAALYRSAAVAAGAVALVVFWGARLLAQGPSAVTQHVYAPIRAYFAAPQYAGMTIMAGDIGAVGYYSDARILDLDGLVWPQMAKYRHKPGDAVRAYHPDMLFLSLNQSRRFMKTADLSSQYAPVARFSQIEAGLKDITAGPSGRDAGPAWSQDYVVFVRKDAEHRPGQTTESGDPVHP